MRGNKPMDGSVTFRASGEEIAAYSQAWRQLGYKSQSEFHRKAGNMLMSGGNDGKHHGVNPTILLEINTHLNRIGSALMELAFVTSNDNIPDGSRFTKTLNGVLDDIKVIRRKVS